MEPDNKSNEVFENPGNPELPERSDTSFKGHTSRPPRAVRKT